MKVFLGGTCNGSTWREHLKPMLTIDYFDPVVKDWTPECMAEEIRQRETCDYCLYVITPEMLGVYSIAEAVDDSNKRPEKTIFCFTDKYSDTHFSDAQARSLKQTGLMIHNNGGYFFYTLNGVADYLGGK